MKTKKLMDSTTNRKVFNQTYKRYLEGREIYCSCCKYHRVENDTRKWYGGLYNRERKEFNIRYPNWKLVSKNRKQWMKKKMNIKEEKSRWGNHIDILFKRN